MKWTVNTASVIGTNHIWDKSNRQDFVVTSEKDGYIYGVVCDGCGSGRNSEFGACLIGNIVLRRLMTYGGIYFEKDMINHMRTSLQVQLILALEGVLFYMLADERDCDTKVKFIENYLLSTFLFFIADCGSGEVIVGSCGDGIIVTDNDVRIIDQSNMPHYIAYNLVPKQYLVAHELTGITVSLLSSDVKKIVIATDGVQPVLNSEAWQQVLYGTTGRQLQRKFNVFQTKDKLFDDDASCIVLEKVE